MRRSSLLMLGLAAALIPTLTVMAQEQTKPFVPVTDEMLQKPNPSDWLMWRRTLDSHGFSPLKAGAVLIPMSGVMMVLAPTSARIVERGFGLALGRSPSPEERALALAFLREQPLREFALALFNLNEFLYVP